MAFDTVIDKAQLEGAITASANAIREKTGDTALIEWLADKGFTEAIAAIQAGGGDIYYEFVTFASATKEYTIEHNLNRSPNFCISIPLFMTANVSANTCFTSATIIIDGKMHFSYGGTKNTASSGKGIAATSYYSYEDKTYEHIEAEGFGTLNTMRPKEVTDKLVTLGNTTYSFHAADYLFICGFAEFRGVQ